MCRRTFAWASRPERRTAYDAFYLALAERLGASLWNANERLVNWARQMGAGWAH